MIAIALLIAGTTIAGIAATIRTVANDGYGQVPTREYIHVFDVR